MSHPNEHMFFIVVIFVFNQKRNARPKMDGTGPEGKGKSTGRGLGKCAVKNETEQLSELGKGQGLRHKEGGGTGKGKRLKSGLK